MFFVENKAAVGAQRKREEKSTGPAQLPATPRPADWARMAGAVRWDPLSLPSWRMVRWACALASYMTCEEPACVLPSLHRSTVATLLAGISVPGHPPIIPVLRNSLERQPHRHKRRYRHLFGGAAHFVGVSQGVSDDLTATIEVPAERITTIYNPVLTPELHVSMAEPPNHPWLTDAREPVILAAGRLVAQKDHATLIKAFARLSTRRPCRLVVLGEGPERKRLERLVRSLDLTNRVALPGWVANPFAFMARASLFALSSTREGLPGVLIQALACGCPCVSTDCPSGPAEILQDGEYGPLVPVGDDAALAWAMERILDQPPDGDLLKEGAARFTADTAVAAYERLLRGLVGSPNTPTPTMKRH